MSTPADLYRDTRERLTELLRDLDDERAKSPVPSTPGWTVTDVMAHCSGLVTDWLNGRTEGFGGETWTKEQVEARRNWPLNDVLDEWTTRSTELEPKMDDPTGHGLPDYMPYLAVADLVIHEHDIRGAIGEPGARDAAGVGLGMKTYVAGVRQRHVKTDLGPMLVRESDGRDWPIGEGDPVATVTAPRFELFRAMAGRRSRRQVLAFEWTGEPEPYVDLFLGPGFAWAEEDLDH